MEACKLHLPLLLLPLYLLVIELSLFDVLLGFSQSLGCTFGRRILQIKVFKAVLNFDIGRLRLVVVRCLAAVLRGVSGV